MAVSIPRFNIASVAAGIESPAQALARGLSQGGDLAVKRRQVAIEESKQKAIQEEARKQAAIDAVLRQQYKTHGKPHIRALADTPGGGVQAYKMLQEEREQEAKDVTAEAKLTEAEQGYQLLPYEKELKAAQAAKYRAEAAGEGVPKGTEVDKLYTSLDTAIGQGDQSKVVTLAGQIAKKRGIDLPNEQRTRLGLRKASWRRVQETANNALGVFQKTPGAIENFRALYRGVLSQAQSAMPGSDTVKGMKERAKDPMADYQMSLLDMLSIDLANAQLTGERNKITEKDVDHIKGVLKLSGFAQSPEKTIQAINIYLGRAKEQQQVIDSELTAPIRTIIQERMPTKEEVQNNKPPTPQTQAEFDAIPKGRIYIDPDDGKRYRK